MKECMNLKDASEGRNNNLNIIRLVAALLVLYMHSFAVSVGNESADIIGKITCGKEYAGGLAVDIFFIISGFLICKSFDRAKSIKNYLIARFLRIWPLLFVTVVVLAFIVGPFITAYTVKDYFAFWFYLLYFFKNLIFLSGYTGLPGVFMNHYYSSVNASLWTLFYEVICYFMVVVTAIGWKKKRITAPVMAVFFGIVFYIWNYVLSINVGPISATTIKNFGRFGLYFAVGMSFYLYSEKIYISWKLALLGIIIIAIGIIFWDFTICFAVGGSCVIFFIGFQKRFVATWYDKVGDLSYGIYLLSFPVQQLVVNWFGKPGDDMFLNMNPYINMGISLLIVVPLAYLTWRFIEKPCLNLKNKIS